MEFFRGLIAAIIVVAVGLGLVILVSWGVSAGISFLFGYTPGVWRTFVALVLIAFGLRFISANIMAGIGGGGR